MKKIVLLSSVLFTCITLTGCIIAPAPGPAYYHPAYVGGGGGYHYHSWH